MVVVGSDLPRHVPTVYDVVDLVGVEGGGSEVVLVGPSDEPVGRHHALALDRPVCHIDDEDEEEEEEEEDKN